PKDSPYQGILTLPGFAALHSHAGRSSPTVRGRAVRELLMCQRVPDPPASVDFSQFNHATQQKVSTARERLTIHNTEKTCSSCHALVDPIGLARRASPWRCERWMGDGEEWRLVLAGLAAAAPIAAWVWRSL
ncbi:MAG TPA: DUF1588 domain-containing protein, partial [Myxococcota bacterium]|nr:DUF1588 domain-containing protein [Myxococcota bacterium]